MLIGMRIENDAIVVQRPEPLSLMYFSKGEGGDDARLVLRETLDGPPYVTTWGRHTLEVVWVSEGVGIDIGWGWTLTTTNRDDPTLPVVEVVAECPRRHLTPYSAAAEGLRVLWARDDEAHDWELAGDPGEEEPYA